ncbi:hypothetical protein EFR84_23120 [Rhizobium chutanense]|uniref:Uncharacterized protein n=1 Tax=Rhizobium chutanense TaxID=2035448 RepID=A0A2A6J617_9HYPH|nr:hypothetical protein CO666_24550 [Rhizobium chutanense]RUM01151.1 hypothetical protein EFR84_23120 [Rhizobium chutanense]
MSEFLKNSIIVPPTSTLERENGECLSEGQSAIDVDALDDAARASVEGQTNAIRPSEPRVKA